MFPDVHRPCFRRLIYRTGILAWKLADPGAEMCRWVGDFDWHQQRIVWKAGAPVVEHIGAAMIDASVWLGDPVNGNGNVARASFQFGDVARLCREAIRLLM